MKGDIAIGFPNYSSKVVDQNHLGFGSKMRIFCESKDKLASFVEIFLPIIRFQFSQSINVGRIKPVPDHLVSGYEAF
ncbi:hypothetical protein, partial [Bacillus cereus]|uniref:hypothetical protein n=1 Tax=Bacillus cereus TaxID=1396 RepID=UPI0034D571BE